MRFYHATANLAYKNSDNNQLNELQYNMKKNY